MSLIADRTVISPPNAAIRVTVISLSQEGRRLLSIRKTVGAALKTPARPVEQAASHTPRAIAANS